jgi:hypothetical protein
MGGGKSESKSTNTSRTLELETDFISQENPGHYSHNLPTPNPTASEFHQLSRTLSLTRPCTPGQDLKSPNLHPFLQSVLSALQFQVVEVLAHPAI